MPVYDWMTDVCMARMPVERSERPPPPSLLNSSGSSISSAYTNSLSSIAEDQSPTNALIDDQSHPSRSTYSAGQPREYFEYNNEDGMSTQRPSSVPSSPVMLSKIRPQSDYILHRDIPANSRRRPRTSNERGVMMSDNARFSTVQTRISDDGTADIVTYTHSHSAISVFIHRIDLGIV